MKEELSVLLVEDDTYVCQQFIELVDTYDDIKLVGITNNAFKALDYIRDILPDAVILDLELNNGCGSGLDLLRGLKTLMITDYPYILITTNNSSAITYEAARQLGADYIMSKHQEGYSEKNPLDFLRMLSSTIKSKKSFKANTGSVPLPQSPAVFEKSLKRRIMSELDLIGINQKSVGHKYLVDAILSTINEPKPNISTTIGKKYGKTESSVERAMQNAINRTWATSDINDLLRYYTAKISSTKGVPTLTEFIFYYANKIKNDY